MSFAARRPAVAIGAVPKFYAVRDGAAEAAPLLKGIFEIPSGHTALCLTRLGLAAAGKYTVSEDCCACE